MPTRTGDRAPPRATRQRLAIAELLRGWRGFSSAQEIHAALRARGEGIGLTTVYRNLALLVEIGDVDVLSRENGEAVYLWCSKHHHHHLVCRSCGHAIEITGPALERWAEKLAERYGYTEISHTLEVYGLCPDCSAADPSRLGPLQQA